MPSEWEADDAVLEVLEGNIDGKPIVVLKLDGPRMRHFLVFNDAAALRRFAALIERAADRMARGSNGQKRDP